MEKPCFTDILPLSEETFNRFKDFIHRETGIFMRESKKILVSNRLRKRLVALGMRCYDEYYRFLTKTEEGMRELPYFIDAVSTNETYFYRGDNQFEALKKTILPELFRKRNRIRVWSAGCSTGEEPYTIAIMMHAAAEGVWCGEMEIVGTDISTEVIDRAMRGVYSGRSLKFVPPFIMEKYLEPQGEGAFGVREWVKRIVQFKVHNLLKDEPPGSKFDVIFCRNVMIYFDKPTQYALVDGSFAKALLPDGYLFIGHSESLIGGSTQFRYVQKFKAPIYVKAQAALVS
jgi:chemotaxis protein methyltransferase CheR